MNKILLVEDNQSILLGLSYLLKEEQFEYCIAKTKIEALRLLDTDKFDMALLDIALPDGNGFELCKYIKNKTDIPVIFLTAKDEEKDVVQGLEIGADDYIIKPFRNRELISRINNVLRRKNKQNNCLICGSMKIDTESAKVFKENEEIELTKLEYKILVNLFSNIGKIITREKILNDIWDIAGNFVEDNTLTVYIKRIREKIGDKDGKMIKTIRGIGYRVDI